jgi:hypothetical protein
VDHLQTLFQDGKVAIAFLYFNYKEQVRQTVSNLIGSLLKQIVQYRVRISDSIKSLYEHCEGRTRPTLNDLMKALKAEISPYTKVFIIVDALDECSEETREYLLRAFQSLAGTVNLLFTSRNLPSIARYFEGTKRLDICPSDEDLRAYVEARFNQSRFGLRRLDVRETVVNRVVQRAQGM